MKKLSLLSLRSNPKAFMTAASISLLAMSQNAEAVLYWDVSQSGADVIVQTVGTLDIGTEGNPYLWGTGTGAGLGGSQVLVDNTGTLTDTYGAAGVSTTLPWAYATADTFSGDAFGTYDGDLFFGDSVVPSSGIIAPVSSMTFSNTTVDELVGSHLDSGPLVAFTHGTGDTIQIRLVPEPSSTALLGLGGLALMLRRRR